MPTGQLHSKCGYGYILLFLLSLAIIHFLSHLLSDSTPHIIHYVANTSIPITKYSPGSYSSSLGLTIRYFFLRYSVYPMLALTYFFDHIRNPSWLKHVTPKTLALAFAATFCPVLLLGKVYYVLRLNNINATIFFSRVAFQGIEYRIYTPILWFCLFALSLHFLQKKFETHHALWLSGLALLSCQDVWELALFLPAETRYAFTAPTVTRYIFWLGPTFLVFYYAQKYIQRLSAPLLLAFFASLLLSATRTLGCYPLSLGDWPLRVAWTITYVLSAYYIQRGMSP